MLHTRSPSRSQDQTVSARIERLINPRSIAIVGASPDVTKLNGRPLHYLIRDGYQGELYPVNPRHTDINGVPCYPSVESLPQAPDLAVVAVAAIRVPETIAALGRLGTPVALVFASGFSEVGAEGAALERTLMATAREHGIRICGPNNLGLINAFKGITATFSQYAQEPPLAGPVAFASQSGAFGTAISALARKRGLGFGYFINTGNQADITQFEALGGVVDDDAIAVLCAYVEGVRDGRELIALAARARSAGKPFVLTKVGRKAAGARAAASHTGSLAGEDRVFDAVLRQHGVIRARNEEHMLDVVSAFTCCAIPEGRGVGIITQSGGAGVLMADRAEELGLEVPELQPATQARLKEVLPDFGAGGNPVDVTGQFLAQPSLLTDSIKIVLDDPNIHVCAVWLQLMEEHADTLVEVFRAAKAVAEKPFIVCWVGAPEAALHALRESGICVIGATERTIDAAAALIEQGDHRRQLAEPRALPEVGLVHEDRASQPVPSIEAAEMLRQAGLSLVPCALAADADEAQAAAERLGYPVAVKIESPDILHKTEAGGIALGLTTPAAVREASEKILALAAAYDPQARISGLLVQAMAEPAAEIVLGLRRDPVFGPVVMVGLGGVFVEVLKDVAFAAAPASPADAAGMLDRLQGRALLDGARGLAPIDRQALISAICALSEFSLAHPELVELDLNPVFADENGVTAVDWMVVVDSPSQPAD